MVNIFDNTSKKLLKKYSKDINIYAKKVYSCLKKKGDYDFSLILCGSRYIKSLNKKYRNIDKVTDVLSFEEEDKTDARYLGEIFINVDRVYSQAKKYGHSLKREYVFLTVHGLLHLFGYDHTLGLKEEKEMFGLQDKIVGNLK